MQVEENYCAARFRDVLYRHQHLVGEDDDWEISEETLGFGEILPMRRWRESGRLMESSIGKQKAFKKRDECDGRDGGIKSLFIDAVLTKWMGHYLLASRIEWGNPGIPAVAYSVSCPWVTTLGPFIWDETKWPKVVYVECLNWVLTGRIRSSKDQWSSTQLLLGVSSINRWFKMVSKMSLEPWTCWILSPQDRTRLLLHCWLLSKEIHRSWVFASPLGAKSSREKRDLPCREVSDRFVESLVFEHLQPCAGEVLGLIGAAIWRVAWSSGFVADW